jgi:hypothetical protein
VQLSCTSRRKAEIILDMTKLIVAFSNFANAPKKAKHNNDILEKRSKSFLAAMKAQ